MPDSDADQVIVVFTTVGSEDQANSISEELVQRNLAACVNVVPAIKSVYRWKGKIWQDEEFLLIIKTTRQAFQALRRAIKTLHSYDLPELLAIPAAMGDDAVLAARLPGGGGGGGVAGKTRVRGGATLGVGREVGRPFPAAAVVPLHARDERLDSPQDEPRLEGRHHGPDGVLDEGQAIGVLLTAHDDRPSQAVGMAVQVLRGAVDDDVGSQLHRPLENGR